jgi:hypothetical protein
MEEARQFSFRLPQDLVERLEGCVAHVRGTGLDLTRADVVRLLLKYALDATRGEMSLLLKPPAPGKRPRRKRGR